MSTPSFVAPFVVLVPVKALGLGKSRLAGVTDERRRDLAAAFALDTIAAARATSAVAEVVVVTSDDDIGAHAVRLDCAVLPDAGGLNVSLRRAADHVGRTRDDHLLVALCADLPGLDPPSLTQALSKITADAAWFVADHLGIGTTLYAAPHPLFEPHFGPASRAAHLGAGALEVAGPLERLRRDVDTVEDLDQLIVAGWLGTHTRRVLEGPDRV